jgi:hypothetical protein
VLRVRGRDLVTLHERHSESSISFLWRWACVVQSATCLPRTTLSACASMDRVGQDYPGFRGEGAPGAHSTGVIRTIMIHSTAIRRDGDCMSSQAELCARKVVVSSNSTIAPISQCIIIKTLTYLVVRRALASFDGLAAILLCTLGW